MQMRQFDNRFLFLLNSVMALRAISSLASYDRFQTAHIKTPLFAQGAFKIYWQKGLFAQYILACAFGNRCALRDQISGDVQFCKRRAQMFHHRVEM
jgi:hypothetical protein